MVGLHVDSATHTVRQALGLLEYFLQHEVVVAALFYLAEVDVNRLHGQFLFLAQQAYNLQLLVATNDGYVAIFEIHHLVGVFHDGAGVRTEEELAVADAHH